MSWCAQYARNFFERNKNTSLLCWFCRFQICLTIFGLRNRKNLR